MNNQATFTLRGRNPDVLTCIANLSNDEVFTPPEFANAMLDRLSEQWALRNQGENIWSNENVTFLDPCTKSGIFLREITTRLTEGLKKKIPDLNERVNHILRKQVFGIGITHLTSLLARRSIYCSKHASGIHSIAKRFEKDEGNIWFERTEHCWINDRCKHCGASKRSLDRGENKETHAYAFIHNDNPLNQIQKIFGENMQFDVIIGNPPYQLSDGGAGTSAIPIYQLFVEQAKSLEPRFLIMVTPARWVAGGKGLDDFRESMLHDRRVRVLVDYLNASDAFPGVDIAGGISYFLWDRDHQGDCQVTTVHKGETVGPVSRKLDEFDVFVRHAPSVAILHKIWPKGPIHEESMASTVSARKAFGFATNDRGRASQKGIKDPIELISSASSDKNREWVDRSDVTSNSSWIDEWKATVGGAAPAGGRPDKEGRYYGLSSIRVLPPKAVCTESYLVAGHFKKEAHAKALCDYMRTRFVRFLVSLRAVTQHVTRGSFAFVPLQDFTRNWTDEDLSRKYDLTSDEIAFIESMVRPMDIKGDAEDV
jgi:site-specific DNA-methyltransferase (adenine-specific)